MNSTIKKEEAKLFEKKLREGLDLAYIKMIAFKKEKKSKIVVMKGDKIVWLEP